VANLRIATGWRFYGWWGIVLSAFVIIWVTNALTLAGLTIYDRHILDELAVSRGALKFGDTLQLLVSAALAPVAGWVADRYGVRPVMLVGALALAAGLLGYSTVHSIGDIYLMRILTGAAMAGAGLVICVTLVSRWFVAHRGLALGLMLSGTSLGNAFVPQLATWLIDVNGWRASFYVLACLPLALLPIIWFAVKEWPERLGLAPYGGQAMVAAGEMTGYTFSGAVRSANFWLIGLSAFCTFYAILALSGNLFLHARDLGLDAGSAAKAFVPLFVGGIAGKLGAGLLTEALPRKLVFALALSLMLAGAIMFTTLSPTLLWPALWLFGIGWGANYTMLQALVADVFGAHSLGKILSAINLMDATGGALGPWITGMLFDVQGDYQLAFGLMGLLIAIALCAAMAVRVPARPAR
jgi:MFS family permease